MKKYTEKRRALRSAVIWTIVAGDYLIGLLKPRWNGLWIPLFLFFTINAVSSWISYTKKRQEADDEKEPS